MEVDQIQEATTRRQRRIRETEEETTHIAVDEQTAVCLLNQQHQSPVSPHQLRAVEGSGGQHGDDQQAAYRLERTALEEELCTTQDNHERLSYSIIPNDRLPPELLVMIFEECIAVDIPASTIALICRTWKDMVFATPQCWHQIHIRVNPRYYEAFLAVPESAHACASLVQLERVLTRSGGALLDIYVEIIELCAAGKEEVQRMVQLICCKENMRRWKRLSWECWERFDHGSFLDFLDQPTRTLHNLLHVSFSRIDSNILSKFFSIIDTTATQLQTFTFCGSSLNRHRVAYDFWSRIHSLDILHTLLDGWDTFRLLTKCSSVTKLHLGYLDQDTANGMRDMPQLQTLVFDGASLGDHFFIDNLPLLNLNISFLDGLPSHVMGYVKLPRLVTLTLSTIYPSVLTAFELPMIQEARITIAPEPEPELRYPVPKSTYPTPSFGASDVDITISDRGDRLIELLECFPEARRLRLTVLHPLTETVCQSLTLSDYSSVRKTHQLKLCPVLQDLHINIAEEASSAAFEASLSDIIVTRKASGNTLRTVSYTRSGGGGKEWVLRDANIYPEHLENRS